MGMSPDHTGAAAIRRSAGDEAGAGRWLRNRGSTRPSASRAEEIRAERRPPADGVICIRYPRPVIAWPTALERRDSYGAERRRARFVRPGGSAALVTTVRRSCVEYRLADQPVDGPDEHVHARGDRRGVSAAVLAQRSG